jgi:NAD(P)-dependent dehydrogenase (short-subunit alcohol dehydrogenase family)
MIRYDYTGRVALITGGSAGIGLATAHAFARAGARVVIAGRDVRVGREAQAALVQAGADALFVRADVRDEDSVCALVEQTLACFGRLDCAVNSAGASGDMKTVDASEQAVWDDALATNVRGVWLSMRYQLPALLASGGGAIVNVSSIYGLAGRAAHHAYVASKHAIIGLTRSVALEYATRGVRINALCPGATRTQAMQHAERVVPEVVAALVAEHPMARMASEDEVASAALWLCSDGASFTTGAPLLVDGGFLAA